MPPLWAEAVYRRLQTNLRIKLDSTREETDIFPYKSGSALYELEPFSEYLATQLAEVLCPQWVSYDLDYHRGKLISKCRLFAGEQVGLAKVAVFSEGGNTPFQTC